jgi:hypothetical protein
VLTHHGRTPNLARDKRTGYTGGMANPHPSTPKSEEQETVNVRTRAVLASRQHLRDLIREHPERARDLLKAGLRLAI